MKEELLRMFLGERVELVVPHSGAIVTVPEGKLCFGKGEWTEAPETWFVECERKVDKAMIGGDPTGNLIMQNTVRPRLAFFFHPDEVVQLIVRREEQEAAEKALGVSNQTMSLEPLPRGRVAPPRGLLNG